MIISTSSITSHTCLPTRVNSMNSILPNAQFSCPNTYFILTTVFPCDFVDIAFIQTIVIGLFLWAIIASIKRLTVSLCVIIYNIAFTRHTLYHIRAYSPTTNCHFMVPIAIAFFVVNEMRDRLAASSSTNWISSLNPPYPETRWCSLWQ